MNLLDYLQQGSPADQTVNKIGPGRIKTLDGEGGLLRKRFPEVYGALAGLLVTAPDEVSGSVLDPNTARVRSGAEYTFPVGTAAQVLPVAGGLLKAAGAGGKIGAGIENYMVKNGMILNAASDYRPDYVRALEKAITEKPPSQVEMPALPNKLADAIAKSREANMQTPMTNTEPYIKANVVGKFDWKRGGIDGQSAGDVADMVNSLLYSGKTKAAASAKGDGQITALINAREPAANIGFLAVDESGRPVLETAYKTKTPKIPQKLGVDVQSGGTRLPTLSPEGVTGSEAFRSSDGNGTIANRLAFVYPQEQALLTAQRNAALPVEQGGLGLHPNNTPAERAAAMGFGDAVYHGTTADFPAFDMSKIGSATVLPYGAPRGAYFAKQPEITSRYAKGEGSNVIPALLNKEGALLNNSKIVVTDKPQNIRSRFAAFDPMRRDSPDILAGLLPLSTIDEDVRNKLSGLLNP